MATIVYLTQNITEITNGLIAHGVNCQGVMGSGVAKDLRDAWPRVFSVYKDFCDAHAKLNPGASKADMLGDTITAEVQRNERGTVYVMNAFTQENYGRDGKVYASLAAVRTILTSAVQMAVALHTSLHIPRIGCGLGGLSWDKDVYPALLEALAVDNVEGLDVFVYDKPVV